MKDPFELSTPASPSIVSRFALSNVYVPVTGVRAGCATFQGPKVPDVSISPFGIGLVSVAMYGIVSLMPSESMTRW